jgi:hypothetical protein
MALAVAWAALPIVMDARAVPAAPPATVASAVTDSGLAAGARLLPARVSVRPDSVRLGAPVRYQAWVLLPRETRAQWLPPDSGGAFRWSTLSAQRIPGANGRDTLVLESMLQVFATGPVSIPGPGVRLRGGRDRGLRRLPTAHLTVVASPGVADSSARLRPLRAPLGAPWWERVPWTKVLLALGLIAAAVAGWIWGRRRRGALSAPAGAPRAPARDPADTALETLEALRRLGLPGRGRFAEHAFQLTSIARRFLEATAGTPRPGDTTPELVSHLEAARLEPADLARLAAVLRMWVQVKFARESSSADEARRAEQVVEDLARRRLLELQQQAQARSASEKAA